MTDHGSIDAHASDGPHPTAEPWAEFMNGFLPVAAVVGPALMVVAALFVAAGVETLPGDLDWISKPEALIGYLATPFFVATWVVIGRLIARARTRRSASSSCSRCSSLR